METYEEGVRRLRKDYDVHVNRLDHTKGVAISGASGAALSTLATSGVKNKYARAAAIIAGTAGGGAGGVMLTPHSLRAKKFDTALKNEIAAGTIAPEETRVSDEFINSDVSRLIKSAENDVSNAGWGIAGVGALAGGAFLARGKISGKLFQKARESGKASRRFSKLNIKSAARDTRMATKAVVDPLKAQGTKYFNKATWNQGMADKTRGIKPISNFFDSRVSKNLGKMQSFDDKAKAAAANIQVNFSDRTHGYGMAANKLKADAGSYHKAANVVRSKALGYTGLGLGVGGTAVGIAGRE